MILAIDFDGVIHDYKHPIQGKRMGPPFPDAEESMGDLEDSGHQLIVFTTKANSPTGKEAVEAWLEFYGIPYHQITAIKPNADVFVDDRALQHTDWQNTMAQLRIMGGDFDED